MVSSQEPKKTQFSASLISTILLISLLIGVIGGYLSISSHLNNLESQISTLNQRVDNIEAPISPNLIVENVSLPLLFDQVRQSVVVVEWVVQHRDFFGRVYHTKVQGSGFISSFDDRMVILTNYHVVADTISINVTFINEEEYSASILRSNQYADLALLSTSAPEDEVKPVEFVSSSTLRVGDSVIVVGTPYGLEGSMSVGIISALNRTLTTEEYSIGSVIQTTAPLNPGNSGGPMLNYNGQVIGMVTAIVEESQGIGFAIPSDTILADVEEII